MQIKSLRISAYKSWAINDTARADAIARMKRLERYDKLRSEACRRVCLKAIGWSKATCYRGLNRYQAQGTKGLAAVSTRPQNLCKPWQAPVDKTPGTTASAPDQRRKLWRKRKIWKVLSRDHGFTLSISMVGRILKKLRRLHRIKPAAFY